MLTATIKHFGHTVATTPDPRAYFAALGLPYTTATLAMYGYTVEQVQA